MNYLFSIIIFNSLVIYSISFFYKYWPLCCNDNKLGVQLQINSHLPNQLSNCILLAEKKETT